MWKAGKQERTWFIKEYQRYSLTDKPHMQERKILIFYNWELLGKYQRNMSKQKADDH